MKPYLERFDDRALVDIRTADVQDFIADLPKPRTIHRRGVRMLSASRVNKIVDLLRPRAERIESRVLGTDLDGVLDTVLPGLSRVAPTWAKKPWARRFGWSLWFSGRVA